MLILSFMQRRRLAGFCDQYDEANGCHACTVHVAAEQAVQMNPIQTQLLEMRHTYSGSFLALRTIYLMFYVSYLEKRRILFLFLYTSKSFSITIPSACCFGKSLL